MVHVIFLLVVLSVLFHEIHGDRGVKVAKREFIDYKTSLTTC